MLRTLLSGLLLVLFVVDASYAQKQKILFDCDLAGDIDDAFALALVLTAPEFDVLGITLGHGMTEKRAQVAARMLYETGMEHIPFAVGRRTANVVGVDTEPVYTPQFHWGEGFDRLQPMEKPAADLIIETLRKHPGEVILITVGPVPNLADVVRKDPGALKLAKGIYSMFGSFYTGYNDSPIPDAEWNVEADVESAKVFAAAGVPITYAGLDVTNVRLGEAMRQRLLMRQSPLTNALIGLYTLWGAETPVLYDVVAVGMVLWPDLFGTRPAHVRVLDGGFTVIDESREPNARVGVSINKEELLRRMMERLLHQNLGRW